MYKKSVLTICITLVGMCALALNSRTLSKSSSIQDSPPSISKSSELPAHVPYMFLFQHVNELRKQADILNRQGKDGSGFQRRLNNALGVDDDKFNIINEVASQCESEVDELDREATAITAAFRVQYPPGRVPEGVIIPPPPAQLIALQGMRTSAILRARDRLRGVLGEQEFARLDEKVKLRLTPGIKRISSE